MASLMGSLMADPTATPTAMPTPTAPQVEAASAEANGLAVALPTTQAGATALPAQNRLFTSQELTPSSPLIADKSATPAMSAFAPLLPNGKPAVAQAQPAPLSADNADLALLRAAGLPQPAATVGIAVAANPNALQAAAMAQQTAPLPGEEGVEDQARPQLEVSTASSSTSSATMSGLASATSNPVQVAASAPRNAAASPLQQIAERVQVTLDQGENSATIRLQPEELGSVRIRLQVLEGQLHLSIHTEKAQTGRLLDQQLGDLRQTLESGGIKVGDLAVLASNRTQPTGGEMMGREAAHVFKTLSMEMGGNSAQHNHHQQQAAFAGQEENPARGNLPHYGQQAAQEGQEGFGVPIANMPSATDAWGWRAAPRGVDTYA
jgi:flagellar hook-length control protein FliK